jgi:dihydrofolate reductase
LAIFFAWIFYLLSTTAVSPHASTWTEALVATDLVADIAKLQEQNGNYILAHGGASFAQDLIRHDLIDEYRLVIHPVVLGKGMPLFSKVQQPFDLKLVESVSFDAGTVANVYARMQR